MDHAQGDNKEAVVELPRLSCTFRRTGQCFEVEGLPADTPCSTQGCPDWCHERCFSRFFYASEFDPDVAFNLMRVVLMVPFCQACALLRRQEYKDEQDQVQIYQDPNRGYHSDTTQAYENEDSNTTQEMDPEFLDDIDSPVG